MKYISVYEKFLSYYNAQDIIKCYHLNWMSSYLLVLPFTTSRHNYTYNHYTILCACLIYIIIFKKVQHSTSLERKVEGIINNNLIMDHYRWATKVSHQR